MSIIDKVVAAVTPLESTKERAEARVKARSIAATGDWLDQVLEHHELLERAFEQVKTATTAASRVEAQKELAVLLTGHAIAEEAILYPAMTKVDEEGRAEIAYNEQAMTKIQMALLESLDPMSQEFLDKLEHIRGAVLHHMFEEESKWFPEMHRKADAAEQSRLTARYNEEFNRYTELV